MMTDPMSRYQLATSHQQELRREVERDRLAREATSDQSSLVERVMQNVWKRLGLPARETGAPQPLPMPSGSLPPLPAA